MPRGNRIRPYHGALVVAALLGSLTGCGDDSADQNAAADQPPAAMGAEPSAMGTGMGTGMGAKGDQAQVEQVDPTAFERRIEKTDGVVIDVHVPEPDEIPGTDHHIAYDRIVGDKRLPDDRATELLIYCRSGSMSATAGQALLDAGYTRVVELEGGYNAWKSSGRRLLPGPGAA